MRHGRGVRLTEPGRLLTTRARSILADIDILSEELLARQTEPQGELSVGLPWSWSEGITAPVVKRFNELYPEVRLNVIADSSETLDRKSVVSGKSGSVRVDIGGRCIIKKKKKIKETIQQI